jgi:propionyl-CoA carboxylase alpha chain
MATCKRLGIKSVAIYSEADIYAKHVAMADEAVCVGPPPSVQSYLSIPNVMEAIKKTGAQAVHPGYGFLSENQVFAKALEEEKVVFIGPPSSAIQAMGDKIESKKLAKKAKVNVIPGYLGEVNTREELLRIAHEIGYPVMIKASAGGGGKGMRIAWNDAEAIEGFRLAKAEAKSSFNDDRMLLEKYIDNPRHIEIQVLADSHGTCLYFPERECSIQRRNQKVVEEAPSPLLDDATRHAMGKQAAALAKAVGYTSAGTVEFLSDQNRNFYFLEMNTRLQVEHPITEKITGVDLVEQMIRVAAGEPLAIKQEDIKINGWAMESRVYAEDPLRNFLPSIGKLKRYREPSATDGTVRVDGGVLEGSEISIYYDPLLSKLVTYGPNRAAAIENMSKALDSYIVRGLNHNIPFLRAVMHNSRFQSGRLSTKFIAEEFPSGFSGIKLSEKELNELVGSAAAMYYSRALRDSTIDGQMRPPSPSGPRQLVVTANGQDHKVTVRPVKSESGHSVIVETEKTEIDVQYNWPVDSDLFNATIANHKVTLQLAQILPLGFRLVHYGSNFDVLVRTPRQAELAAFMPAGSADDMSSTLRSPMPGLVLSIAVKPGDKVVLGQELAVIEAMKMQNVLRAEKDAVIEKVVANAGTNIGVDEVILQFKK